MKPKNIKDSPNLTLGESFIITLIIKVRGYFKAVFVSCK